MTGQLPKVCVIGACSCGLPVIKAFKQRGIPVTCYENTANIGRLWCIENKATGATTAYDSLHINYVSLWQGVSIVIAKNFFPAKNKELPPPFKGGQEGDGG
jgi:cation diffusion facilitator CzcD-associated flavoprotein CzcO